MVMEITKGNLMFQVRHDHKWVDIAFEDIRADHTIRAFDDGIAVQDKSGSDCWIVAETNITRDVNGLKLKHPRIRCKAVNSSSFDA